jgi:HK97 family phage portal protein
MGIFDFFRSPKGQQSKPAPRASSGDTQYFDGFSDPDLLDFMRKGVNSEAGAYISATNSLKNMAVLRCVRLISEAIGMLPLHVYERGDEKRKAEELPIYSLLKSAPNNWQTAYEFKSQMQANALLYGNAYALIVRSMGRVIRMVPLDPTMVKPELSDDWVLTYKYTKKNGGTVTLSSADIFHLRDLTIDGVCGLSRVKMAREAIGLAQQAEKAAAKLFKNGMMVGGSLTHPGTLSTEAYGRLQESMQDRYAGADNAGKWMILEEGMKADGLSQSAVDSQHIENRKHQIEEIARAFGVPRTFLMMDDTSWGSGIEQLGIYFVQYTLSPWFSAWEQAIERSLLSDAEKVSYYAKFNERALLRGTLKDQSEFFAKSLGSGGHSPWMSVNEIRELSDMPRSDDENADSLRNPLFRGTDDEPENTA